MLFIIRIVLNPRKPRVSHVALSCILKRALFEYMAARASASQGLEIQCFDGWHPEFDKALELLPETSACPHELYRLLIQNPGSRTKRTILFTERGHAVALLALRQREEPWEPLTKWILPGFLFPVKEGCLSRVISAIPLEVCLAWWRQKSSPPESRMIRCRRTGETYKMLCSENFELYWKSSGHLNTVRRIRNRCRDFEFEVNPTGAAEWVIRNWGIQWNVPPDELEDRIVAARYLEKTGHHYTLVLSDGHDRVAGHTFLSHNGDAVWQVSYRNPDYERQGVGTRLMELAFQWAAESRFRKIDLGGDHEYKLRWAPRDGVKQVFTVCPGYIMLAKRASKFAWRVHNKLYSNLKKNGFTDSIPG